MSMNIAAVATRRLPILWGRSAQTPNRATPANSVAGMRGRATATSERRLTFAAMLGALTVVGVALLLVWVRLQVVNGGYELSTARHLAHRLEQEQRELEIEIATLTSPRRLETLARERLGMTPPAPGQIVSVP